MRTKGNPVRFASMLMAALLAVGGAARAQAPTAAAPVQEMQARVSTLRAQVAATRAALPRQRAALQAGGFPALALSRQEQFQQAFEQRAADFERVAALWQADPSDAHRAELDRVLAQQASAGKRTRALPATLPWGPARTKREPAETKTSWWNRLTRDDRIQLAQAGSLTTLGGVQFSSLPAAGEEPVDADLAVTPEVQLTPAIRAKAAELGKNPVQIADWVRRNVRFEPTWGATQTAEAVLQGGHGNAVDAATLTIALLRASGIPARYQFGTVDVPAAALRNWLGGVATTEGALQLLADGGIAARGIGDAGTFTIVRMEHAWVQAYVYWSPARGSRNAGADLQPPQHPSPNAALNAWVPIDTAFKQHASVAGLNLQELAPFNAAGALDAARQGATCTAASAQQVNQSALAANYAQFKTQAQQQLGALGSDTLVGQVLGTNAISTGPQALLPGTLPMATVVSALPTSALTGPMRWRLQIGLSQDLQQVVGLDRSLTEVQGKVISLSFAPETDADAQTLQSLLRPASGGDPLTGLPTSIAAYLVRVKAQLFADGQLVAEGGSFTLGQGLTLRSMLQNVDGTTSGGETTILAGETHAWAVQGTTLGATNAAAAAQRLATLAQQVNDAQLPTGSAQARELLYGLAATYQAGLDAKSRLYQRAANAVEVRLPGLARASSRLEAQESLGLVVSVRATGVGLSADRLGASAGARGSDAITGYTRQSLERASAEAHQLLNRVFGAAAGGAQSALSGLAVAAGQGQTIWRADAATLAQALAGTDAASTVREQIQQGVANGMQAMFAGAAVDLGGPLPMDPLVLLDPASGGAAYSVASRGLPVVQQTAHKAGLAGWLGLADAQASKALVTPAIGATTTQLNTAQTLLGDIDALRWQAFAGQADVVDALYQARIGAAASTANACDWLISTLASQLGAGLPDTQRVNRAPVISSLPVATATADAAYAYAVQAQDPDGDALAWRLVGAPTGMTISSTGQLAWAQPVVGQFAITVQVSDGVAVTEQPFKLTVGAAGALQVNLALTPTIADAGQTVTLVVQASSSSGSVTRSATIDGAPLALDPQGVAVFAAPAAGAHPIVVTATDGVSTVSRETVLTVKSPTDTTAPAAAITSPEADSGVRGVIAIGGTATDAQFAYYQLLLRRVGDPDTAWQEVGRGLAPVSAGTLGQLDTSRYGNGLYQIALRVVDVNGAQTSASVTLEFLGNLKLGQFRLSFADIRLDAGGLPLMLTRTYDSTKKDVAGDFGWGWSASGQDITVRKNMTLGMSWEVVTQQFQLCLRPVGKRRISITLPDGGLYRFDAKNAQECAFGTVPEVDIQFNALPGPTGGPAGRVGSAAQLRAMDGALLMAQGGMIVDADIGAPWNPKDFELTTEEGVKYFLREGVGILSVTDPFGNKVTYGPNGYQHTANLGISFTRDGQGRITSASDPSGQKVTYTYNAQGELASVTDRQGGVTRFAYATVAGTNTGATSGNADQQHLLASITDPRGQVVMSNQFDAYGRLTGSADALGQAATQEYDTANFKQTVTDRRGNKTVYTFDADGNITEVVNALGEKTSYTFDANGNETSVTDALGHTATRTFDSFTGKQLTERDPLGNTVTTGYRTVGTAWQRQNVLSTTDARNNTTSYAYEDETQPGAVPSWVSEPLGRTTAIGQDIKGNLRSLDIAGEKLSYEYDDKGRKTRETNGLGQVTTYSYDTAGNELTRTVTKSVNGGTVTLTTTRKYDSENRLVEETDPLGGKRSTTYNAAGKVATQTDSLGRVTSYEYDANARLVKTSYPDGTSEATAYDAEGNETAKTDRAGRTTRMEYDALNRLAKTIYPDGTFESTSYDAAGRVTARTDRRGRTSTMEYDAAGRQTASVDAAGVRTSQTFDANGNRTSVTVDGRTTNYEYDALNRLTKTTWPDGSTHTTVYRPDNRKESETDQRGVTTTYGYDAAGRLNSVKQSLSATATATTTYGYDETGAKIQQVDALGRTTTWTVDGNGRITSRTIQDGSTERSQYDAEGNRLSRSTFAGETITYQYDADNRLKAQLVPAGTGSNAGVPAAIVSYNYTASGQIASQVEQGATTLNGTQAYKYDSNDRLVEVSGPTGTIRYAYDAAGNITERSYATPGFDAGTIRYTYDDANRMTSVTAPDGKAARYTYDAAGRLATTERDLNPQDGQPQLLVTYRAYDAADRQIAIATTRKTGATETLIAGQGIIRGPGGTVTRLDTYRSGTYDPASGQYQGTPDVSQAFEYDGNARLTRELRTKAGVSTDTHYEYDAAGNRTKKTVSTAAGTDVTTYSYDSADRLQQESVALAGGGTAVTTYTWDGNGNLASKSEPGKVTLYRFDAQNRLVDVRAGATLADAQGAAPVASYGYDASGNRIKRSGADAGNYLIDTGYSYSQLGIEASADQSTTYVRGLELIRQTRTSASGTEQLFPVPGHLGSSLGAADANGAVIEQVDADAFGRLSASDVPKQTHLYTGEYWDQDAQLFYLRARWYNPRIGRFVSADPYEGKQNDSRSLNRYAFSRGDPIHNSDPSGEMTLGEVGSAMDTTFTLATRAYNAYDTINSFLGGDESSDKPGLWDSLLASAIKGIVGSIGNDPAGLALAVAATTSGTHKHHTIPEYMCGHPDQNLAKVDVVTHTALHTELYALEIGVNVLGQTYDLVFRRKKPSDFLMSPIKRLGRSPMGRAAIAEGLHAFYQFNGWGAKGSGGTKLRPPPNNTIMDIFLQEKWPYITHHFNNSCKKK